jgi:hypothetical protein
MGLAIKAAGANFTNFVRSLTLVDRTSLLAEYHLGVSNAASIVNHANAAAPMAVVGSPVHSDLYTTCTTGVTPGENNFNMQMTAPDGNATVMALVRKKISFPPILSYDSGTPFGLTSLSGAPSFHNSQSGTTADVANLSLPAHSDFFLLVGVGSLGAAGLLHIWEADVRTSNTAEAAGPSSRGTLPNLRLGASGSGNQTVDIAWAAMFGRALGTTELDDNYAALKAFFTDRGLTVS